MRTPPTIPLRFQPSRVEGLPAVAEVAVYPDRLELLSAGRWVTIPLVRLARASGPTWWRRLLVRLRGRPGGWPVADHLLFDTPTESLLAFYARPPLRIWLRHEEPGDYATSDYFQTQWIIRFGGYSTFDIG